jgi:hypothetical protein
LGFARLHRNNLAFGLFLTLAGIPRNGNQILIKLGGEQVPPTADFGDYRIATHEIRFPSVHQEWGASRGLCCSVDL